MATGNLRIFLPFLTCSSHFGILLTLVHSSEGLQPWSLSKPDRGRMACLEAAQDVNEIRHSQLLCISFWIVLRQTFEFNCHFWNIPNFNDGDCDTGFHKAGIASKQRRFFENVKRRILDRESLDSMTTFNNDFEMFCLTLDVFWSGFPITL